MNWVFIITVAVVVGFILLKFTDLKHRLRFILFSFAIIFLMLSAGYVYITNDLDFSSTKGIFNAWKIYFAWLSQIASNIAKVSGYVVERDWGINATNISSR